MKSKKISKSKHFRVKSPSSAPLMARYILRYGQNQQHPHYTNRKIHLAIRGADEGNERFDKEQRKKENPSG